MRLLRGVRNSPVLLLILLAVGFGAWVVIDLVCTRRPATPPGGAPPGFVPHPLPAPNVSLLAPTGPRILTAELVSRLQPGMLRSEVEAVIGLPPAELVQPVSEVDGKLVYQTAYLANLDPPVAPAAPGARPLPAPFVPKSLIALEFDASRPGHPLLKVRPAGLATSGPKDS